MLWMPWPRLCRPTLGGYAAVEMAGWDETEVRNALAIACVAVLMCFASPAAAAPPRASPQGLQTLVVNEDRQLTALAHGDTISLATPDASGDITGFTTQDLALDPAGTTLAATDAAGKTVTLWDISDAAHPNRLRTLDGTAVAFTRPSGFAVGLSDGAVAVYPDHTAPAPRCIAHRAGSPGVVQLAASPHDPNVVAASWADFSTAVVHLADCRVETLPGVPGLTLSYAPRGPRLALSDPLSVRIHDPSTHTTWRTVPTSLPWASLRVRMLDDHTVAILRLRYVAGRGVLTERPTIEVHALDPDDATTPPRTFHACSDIAPLTNPARWLLACETGLVTVPAPDHAAARRLTPVDGHAATVSALAVAPDARLAASADASSVLIWDLHARRPIASLATSNVLDLRFSNDSAVLYSATANDLRAWSTATWQLIDRRTSVGHEPLRLTTPSLSALPSGGVAALADLPPDPAAPPTSPQRHAILLWRPGGEPQSVTVEGCAPGVVDIRSGNSYLIPASWKGLTHRADGKDTPAPGSSCSIEHAAMDPAGRRVALLMHASGPMAVQVLVWEPGTDTPPRQLALPHDGLRRLTFAGPGWLVGTGLREPIVWDLDRDTVRVETVDADLRALLRGDVTVVPPPAASIPGTDLYLHAAGQDLIARRMTDGAVAFTLSGGGERLATVAFGAGPHELVTTWTDDTLEVRDWRPPGGVRGGGGVEHAAVTDFHPASSRVARAFAHDTDDHVLASDVSVGSLGRADLWSHRDLPGAVADVAFTPDGARVVALLDAPARTDAVVWDAADGTERARLHLAGLSGARTAFSPDGARVVVHGWAVDAAGRPRLDPLGYPRGVVETWDVATGRRRTHVALPDVAATARPPASGFSRSMWQDPARQLGPLAVAAHAERALVVDATGRALVVDLAGATSDVLVDDAWVAGGVLAPDGELAFLATPSALEVWRVTGSHDVLLSRPAEAPLRGVALDALGARVATLGADGVVTVMRWSAAELHLEEAVSVRPMADGAFVAWTPDGSYWATPEVEAAVAWRIGDALLPFGALSARWARPAAILTALAYPDQDLVAAYAEATRDRLARLAVGSRSECAGPVPSVALDGPPPFTTDAPTLELAVTVDGGDCPLRSVTLRVDGVPSRPLDLPPGATRWSGRLSVPLVVGDNEVRVDALDVAGRAGQSDTGIVQRHGDATAGALYVVSVGVSRYADHGYDLVYAAKDARDVAAALDVGNLDRPTQVTTLTDAAVTREAVARAFKTLSRVHPEDTVVVFFAGHGLLAEDGTYVFATHDLDFAAPTRAGITFPLLEAWLEAVPARDKLVLIDTCHAGETNPTATAPAALTGDVKVVAGGRGAWSARYRPADAHQIGVQAETAFADAANRTGATILVSSGGEELAYEGADWKNGVFTLALREALGFGHALAAGASAVDAQDLARFARARVITLTAGRQRPVNRQRNAHRNPVVAAPLAPDARTELSAPWTGALADDGSGLYFSAAGATSLAWLPAPGAPSPSAGAPKPLAVPADSTVQRLLARPGTNQIACVASSQNASTASLRLLGPTAVALDEPVGAFDPIAFNPPGSLLGAFGARQARVYDLRSAHPVATTIDLPPGLPIAAAALPGDGTAVLIRETTSWSPESHEVRAVAVDLATGAARWETALACAPDDGTTLRPGPRVHISADGRFVVCRGAKGIVALDLAGYAASGAPPVATALGWADPDTPIALDPSGRFLGAVARGARVWHLYDLRAGRTTAVLALQPAVPSPWSSAPPSLFGVDVHLTRDARHAAVSRGTVLATWTLSTRARGGR